MFLKSDAVFDLSSLSDTSPLQWTVAQVGQWLVSIGFPQYVQVFTENEIDGEALADLGNDILKDFVKPGGHRVKILKARHTLFAK